MYVIIDKEAGNIIEQVETIEQAQQIIAEYEAADKNDGAYTPDFYAIKEKSDNGLWTKRCKNWLMNYCALRARIGI